MTQTRNNTAWRCMLFTLILTVCCSVFAAATPTTTALSVSSNNVTAGTAVTLSATVTAGATPVPAGLVNFCNASAARCADAAILGSAWVTRSGTASIKQVFPVGTRDVVAVFTGTSSYAPSTSGVASVYTTRSAKLGTATALTVAGTPGNYTLTGTVSTTATPGPTGTITFLNVSNGNYALGSASISAPVLASTFPASATPATTTGNRAIVAADFNGDGITDLLVASSTSPYTVSVLLGTASGNFNKQPATYTACSNPQAAVAADFDQDGKLDVAFACNAATGVLVFKGNGDGTFTPLAPPAVSSATSVAVGDFDGDGIPDLIVASSSPSYAAVVLKGIGDGTFTVVSSTPIPSWSTQPNGIAVADFNGDGSLDAAVTSPSQGSVTILLGAGDGTLAAINTYATGSGDQAVVAGDFDGDGVPDLAIANYGSGTLSVLKGNGTGSFTPLASPTTGTGPFSLVAHDFNGDGVLDLAVANYGSSTVSIFTGNGDGTFSLSASVPTGSAPDGVVAGDFNGDGAADIATANAGVNTSTALLQSVSATAIASVSGVSIAGVTSGSQFVLASYSGDNSYLASQSATRSLTGSAAPTTIVLNASPASPAVGASVTLTATISPNPLGNYVPSGSVEFFDGATALGTANLSSGVAVFTTAAGFVTTGVHSLTAVYSGDTNFQPSTSAALPLTVAAGTPSMSCSAFPSATAPYGGINYYPGFSVSLAGFPLPTGTLSMYMDGGATALKTDSITGSDLIGAPLWSVETAGVHSFTLTYSGNSSWSTVSCTNSFTVTPATVYSTTVGSSNHAATFGSSITFSINDYTFSYPYLGALAPTGSVTFYADGVSIGTIPVDASAWAGYGNSYGHFAGSLSTSTLSPGAHSITASYTGDTNYAPLAATGAYTQSVAKATPTVTLTPSSTSTHYGDPVTFTVSTTGVAGYIPTGNIQFLDGAVSLATVALSGGQAVFSTSALHAGSHLITASYSGDSDFLAITSSSSTVNVAQVTPAVTWATPASIVYGTPLGATQLNATTTVAGAFVYTPASGTILTAGTQTLSVAFTPTDLVDYTAASASVSLVVIPDAPATIQSPVAGSVVGSANVAFTWTAGTGATQYQLLVGTSGAGASDLYNSGLLTATSATLASIPANASPIYVRLLSKLYSGWAYIDYTYTESGTPTPAAIQTPVAGSVLASTSVAFTWSAGVGVTGGYQLLVGSTGAGSSDLYASGVITATTATASIPATALPVYVRLLSKLSSGWSYLDYTYTASGTPTPAAIQTPVSGSVLGTTNVAFTWNSGVAVTSYQLLVGTTAAGSSDLYSSGVLSGTTATVGTIPANAATVYVRLYSRINGVWQYNDYTYTESGTPTPAAIQTPTNGSILGTTNVAFTWNTGVAVTSYQLLVGTTAAGSSDLYASGAIAATTATVGSIPANAATVYVRLYSRINGVWQYNDYTYTESGTPTPAVIQTPVAGSKLGTANVVFTWNTGVAVTGYQLLVGTTGAGSSNLYSSGVLATTTATITSLPANAVPVYVRLFSKINGVWQYNDYTYTEAGTTSAAILQTPVPGSTLGTTNVKFTWSAGVGVNGGYQLMVGTTGVGSSNLYSSGVTASTTATVPSIPAAGAAVYVRLFSKINGVWSSNDYTYIEQ